LPKVEHTIFKGRVMPNEDEYQKPVQLNLGIVLVLLEYHNSPLDF